MRPETKPRWWLLYAIAVLLMTTLGLVEAAVGAGGLRTVLEAIAALGGFALIGLWLRLNRLALELDQARRRL